MLDRTGASPDATRASFFRFFDGDGLMLSPENHPAGLTDQPALQEALSRMAKGLREDDEQAVGFIALARGNRPSALRRIVLTKIRGPNGKMLGALVVGFPLTNIEDTEVDRAGAIQSGIWLDQRLYIETLSLADRQLVSERLRAASSKETANHFPIDLESGPHLLYYKALDPETQFAPAYQVCLYPLSASIRDEQALRWKIIAFGLVVLSFGFAASLFVAKGLSKPVEKIVAGSVENLTRRKQAEEDLRETNRELEKALTELKATQQQVIQQERLSAIGQMASGIAHDFNNTLTPILGFAELLLENPRLLENRAETRRCLEMLRTSAKETSVEEENAVIRVRDNGAGMTESVRQRCLEPFFSTKGERGTGLGLSMVYGIIERHRGKLDIESAPGQGTTFIIRLPIADASAMQNPESSAQASAKSSLNVLIVDDEPRVLEVVSAYLRCDGHSVSTAASGREGLEKFRRNQFDLVVLDRVMPEMSGDQTARFIKQVNERIPVIMLTGFGALIEVSGSQPAAVDVVLNKPVTLDVLRKTIGKLLHAA